MISTHINDVVCIYLNVISLLACINFKKNSTLAVKVNQYHLMFGICKNVTFCLLHIIKMVRNVLEYIGEQKGYLALKTFDPEIICAISIVVSIVSILIG